MLRQQDGSLRLEAIDQCQELELNSDIAGLNFESGEYILLPNRILARL